MRGLDLAKRVNFSQSGNLAKRDLAGNVLILTQNGIILVDYFANLAQFVATPKVKRIINAK